MSQSGHVGAQLFLLLVVFALMAFNHCVRASENELGELPPTLFRLADFASVEPGDSYEVELILFPLAPGSLSNLHASLRIEGASSQAVWYGADGSPITVLADGIYLRDTVAGAGWRWFGNVTFNINYPGSSAFTRGEVPTFSIKLREGAHNWLGEARRTSRGRSSWNAELRQFRLEADDGGLLVLGTPFEFDSASTPSVSFFHSRVNQRREIMFWGFRPADSVIPGRWNEPVALTPPEPDREAGVRDVELVFHKARYDEHAAEMLKTLAVTPSALEGWNLSARMWSHGRSRLSEVLDPSINCLADEHDHVVTERSENSLGETTAILRDFLRRFRTPPREFAPEDTTLSCVSYDRALSALGIQRALTVKRPSALLESAWKCAKRGAKEPRLAERAVTLLFMTGMPIEWKIWEDILRAANFESPLEVQVPALCLHAAHRTIAPGGIVTLVTVANDHKAADWLRRISIRSLCYLRMFRELAPETRTFLQAHLETEDANDFAEYIALSPEGLEWLRETFTTDELRHREIQKTIRNRDTLLKNIARATAEHTAPAP